MPSSSTRLQNLPPYVFVGISKRIRELASQGHDVIRLDIGNPDMPPPEHIVQTLSASAQQADTHGYSGYRGTADFRLAVAAHYERRFGVKLNPETEILPLIGSKEGIVNLCTAYLDPGDTVLLPSIGYPAYEMAARLNGANIVWVEMEPQNGFLMNLDAIPEADLKQAKMLWVNYPNNPTGATADKAFYQKLVNLCHRYDILLASDNPYVEITFDSYCAPSVLEATDALETTVEFMSFSKAYNMAGWRLGAAVGQSTAIANLLQVKSNMDSGHFKAIYDAGINALTTTTQEWIDTRNAIYQARRDRVLQALDGIGLAAAKPLGTMYVWARAIDVDADEYITRALNEAFVSLAPGSAYGRDGHGWIRISIGVPDARLDEALDRLRLWYKEQK